jgi:hypothetical protein
MQKKSQFINKLHPILIEEGSENMTKIIAYKLRILRSCQASFLLRN